MNRPGKVGPAPWLTALALACWPIAAVAQTQPASYTASWASVDQHPPAPEWFKDIPTIKEK